jgi:hypothetical protein
MKKTWLQIILFLVGTGALLAIFVHTNLFEAPAPLIPAQPQQPKTGERQIPIMDISPRTFAIAADQTYWIAGETQLLHIDENGHPLEALDTIEPVQAITVSADNVLYTASDKQIRVFTPSPSGWRQTDFPLLKGQPLITSLTLSGDQLFVADAGNKELHAYARTGKMLWTIKGKDGFIIPSPYFDIVPDGKDGVWVVNPARHRVENYDDDGQFVAMWQPDKEHPFLGCCNPAHLAILPGDRFVTLEKGLIQSRIFSPAGHVEQIIARRPQLLRRAAVSAKTEMSNLFHYELAVHTDGRIVILAADENILCVFSPGNQPAGQREDL